MSTLTDPEYQGPLPDTIPPLPESVPDTPHTRAMWRSYHEGKFKPGFIGGLKIDPEDPRLQPGVRLTGSTSSLHPLAGNLIRNKEFMVALNQQLPEWTVTLSLAMGAKDCRITLDELLRRHGPMRLEIRSDD